MRGKEGADPAAVAFDAVSAGIDRGVDVVLIDTAGRLHTKTGLMDELGKVKRVVEKKAAVDEVILVLDSTVGQNGLMQAKTFARHFLQNLEVSLEPGYKADWQMWPIPKPRDGLKVTIKPV